MECFRQTNTPLPNFRSRSTERENTDYMIANKFHFWFGLVASFTVNSTFRGQQSETSQNTSTRPFYQLSPPENKWFIFQYMGGHKDKRWTRRYCLATNHRRVPIIARQNSNRYNFTKTSIPSLARPSSVPSPIVIDMLRDTMARDRVPMYLFSV